MARDVRGVPVESYKLKPGLPTLLKEIRALQRKMKNFQKIKAAFQKQFDDAEKVIMTQGSYLMSIMPEQPIRDMEGMNFQEEDSRR